MSISRQEERAVRDIGRRALEKAATAGSDKQSKGVSRMFATVTRVGGDGTLDVDSGSAAHPQQMLGLRMTSACYGVQIGNRVVVDTYAHVSVVTGILASSDSAPYVTRDVTLGSSDPCLRAWVSAGVVTVDYLRQDPGFWTGNPGEYVRLGTMPEGLRPRADLRQHAVSKDGAVVYMYVGADGAVGFVNLGSAGAIVDWFFGCSVCYAPR